MLKVILLCDVPGQGKKNEILNVSDGFANNFLLRQKKAIPATENAIKKLETAKIDEEKRKAAEKEKSDTLAKKIDGTTIEITAESKEGKLFGAVGSKEIQEALAKKGFSIDKKFIVIDKPIKNTGEYTIDLNLSSTEKTKITLKIA